MKRTLLVDTNRAAYPIYRALCSLGHEVWVVGGKPSETLAKLAPNYMRLDYSDPVRLAAFVEEKGFDYLVPGCTDVSYRVCTEINNGRFPGIETPDNTSAINRKSEFRKVAEKTGVPVPRVLTQKEAVGVDAVIVKPVDSFSGRGMAVLNIPSSRDLAGAFQTACKASKTGAAIIEEFVSGQLYSHSAFIHDEKVFADFIVQEDCTINPFTVDTSRVTDQFPAEILASLRNDIERFSSFMGLTDGLMHTQFIARDGQYWIIEMTRRCPGDIYSLLIEFTTGYPYAMAYAAPFIGKEAPRPNDEAQHELIIRHTATSGDGAALWGFRFTRPVDIRLFVPLATSGDYIESSPYGRAGIFFLRASSKDDQDTLYQELLTERLYTFS